MGDPTDEDDERCPLCGAPAEPGHVSQAHPTAYAAITRAATRGRADRTPDQW